MAKKENTRKIPELDGLRGICALAVLISHLIYGTVAATYGVGVFPGYFLAAVGSFAHLAVLIFFILSGFVIGYTTPDKFTLLAAKAYLIKRIIRLYPIYLIALILSFIALNKGFNITSFLGHLIFTQGWLVPLIETNGPLWSLHYEFMFYLLFLVVWRWRINLNTAIYICIGFAFLSTVIDLHIFKILGYFTLWLIGLWIVKHKDYLLKVDKFSSPYRFWVPVFIVVAFEWSNSFEILINKYTTKSTDLLSGLPSVLTDIILSGLIGSIITTLIGYKLPGYKLSFTLALLGTISAIIYSVYKGLIYSMPEYQIALFFLAIMPITFFLRPLPINALKKVSFLGSISYALYVIHSPIQIIIYKQLPLETPLFLFWGVNLIVAMLSLVTAWLLECQLHPMVAQKLRFYLD